MYSLVIIFLCSVFSLYIYSSLCNSVEENISFIDLSKFKDVSEIKIGYLLKLSFSSFSKLLLKPFEIAKTRLKAIKPIENASIVSIFLLYLFFIQLLFNLSFYFYTNRSANRALFAPFFKQQKIGVISQFDSFAYVFQVDA